MTGRLTNRDLLFGQHLPQLLTGLERQRQFVLRVNCQENACPSCGTLQNIFSAGATDVDAYDFGATSPTYVCIAETCRRPLRQVVPITGGWHWAINHDKEKERTAS